MGEGKIQQSWDWVMDMTALIIGRRASSLIEVQRIPELDGLFKVLVLEQDDSFVDDGHFVYSVEIGHLLFVWLFVVDSDQFRYLVGLWLSHYALSSAVLASSAGFLIERCYILV
jgi:hypothetical protein